MTVFTTWLALFHCVISLASTVTQGADETLPSWNNNGPKAKIAAFVGQVTKEGSPDFVAPAERIAVFDNDGTLWAEQPMCFQAFFVFERIKQLAPQHPEWGTNEPFASVLKGDVKAALAGGERGLVVHHTDADREWAYDRASHIGKLSRGLDEAAARGWTVVDLKTAWNAIYKP